MKTPAKLLIVAALAVAVAAVVILKPGKAPTVSASVSPPPAAQAAPEAAAKLPRLLDLGSVNCIPCKMMAPILEELKKEYAGRMRVDFIDVFKDEAAGKQYNIEIIPTQIFFDAEGKERFRHVGFFGKEDILGKWKELGVDLAHGTTLHPTEPRR